MKIIRSKRKNIALVIERDGSLLVRAPFRCDRIKIEQLIAANKDWIEQRQLWVRLNNAPPHRFKAGEFFYFLGNTYRFEFVIAPVHPLVLQNAFLLDRNLQKRAREEFVAWYRDQTRIVINSRLPKLAARFQLSYKSIRITSALKRWGSCSNRGTLNFTWRLVMLPMDVIDYVIAHELAHLKIHNHSAAFWKYLEQHSPNYRIQRKWLRDNEGKFAL
jgi:predicted metal-dependent hydrolase